MTIAATLHELLCDWAIASLCLKRMLALVL